MEGDCVGHLVHVVGAADGDALSNFARTLEVGVLAELAEVNGGDLAVVHVTVTVLPRGAILALALVVPLLDVSVLAIFIVRLERLVCEESLFWLLLLENLVIVVTLRVGQALRICETPLCRAHHNHLYLVRRARIDIFGFLVGGVRRNVEN